MIIPHYANKLPWLKQLLSHVDIDTRETAARLLGMASSGLPTTAASALISELVFSVSDTRKIRFGKFSWKIGPSFFYSTVKSSPDLGSSMCSSGLIIITERYVL